MAAVVNANTISFTSSDADSSPLSGANIQLVGVIIGNSSGNGTVVLGDDISGASYPVKVTYEVAANQTIYHDYSASPIVFPKGIRIKSVSANTTGTLIFRRVSG